MYHLSISIARKFIAGLASHLALPKALVTTRLCAFTFCCVTHSIPPEKVRILGAAEVPKGETVNEDEELVRDNPPIVPESEDGGPLDGPPALPPLVPPKHGSSMRLAGADEYDEDEGADAGK